MSLEQKPPPSRREFLGRVLGASLGLAAAGALAAWRYRGQPPPLNPPPARPYTLPDFRVKGPGALALAEGGQRAAGLQAALKAVGGLERFVARGDTVLLKVNAAFASPPQLGATTHPALLEAMARLCFKAGARRVLVTDNPINDPASCFQLSGLAAAARAAGAELLLPRPDFFRSTTLAGGKLIVDWPLLAGPLAGVSKLIGLAPVKDHHRSGASLTMKNWYGLLGGRRNLFHQDINNIIKELAILVRPTLVVLDGTVSMMHNGPTGGSLQDLKRTNALIVSTDQVAADTVGARLLRRQPRDLPWLALAQAAGAGTMDVASLKPLQVKAKQP